MDMEKVENAACECVNLFAKLGLSIEECQMAAAMLLRAIKLEIIEGGSSE